MQRKATIPETWSFLGFQTVRFYKKSRQLVELTKATEVIEPHHLLKPNA